MTDERTDQDKLSDVLSRIRFILQQPVDYCRLLLGSSFAVERPRTHCPLDDYARSASRAAAMVRSISASPWAVDTNAASNWEGAR